MTDARAPLWNEWNDWLSTIREVLPASTTRPEILAAWDALDHLRTAFRHTEAWGARPAAGADAPSVEELQDYAALLERGLGAHEARETVWPSGGVRVSRGGAPPEVTEVMIEAAHRDFQYSQLRIGYRDLARIGEVCIPSTERIARALRAALGAAGDGEAPPA